jgi:CHAT domain-containing protein/Tfp pilus assembly protein PilF
MQETEAGRARRLQARDRHRHLAIQLANAGKLDDAVREVEAALAIERDVVGSLSEDVAESLGFLAGLHVRRGDWPAARKARQDVLALRERQPDRKDWRIADARRALADLDRRAALDPAQRQRLDEADQQMRMVSTRFRQAKYAEGIGPCRKAMKIRGELLGENHPDYAASLNNLAVLYREMGDYAKAEPLYRQALEIKKRVLGENHPDYAASLNNLAISYHAMGNYAKAEPLYRQALVIKKRVLGENHPDYAGSLNNLAGLYQAKGDYAKAEPLARQALEIHKRVLGENHPNYATSVNNLAALYRDIGDYAKAEPLDRQALEIKKRVLGENHPNYAASLNSLAVLYQTMGDYAKAEQLYRQALEIKKRVLGENHPQYAESLNNLGLLYQDMGDYAKAEPLSRQALEIRKRVLGENHPDYATSLHNLAELYWAMGDYAKAEPLCRQALEIRKRVLGENHPQYAESLNNLGLLYQDMGDYAKAEPLSRQALEIKKRVLGENHPENAHSLGNLARLYLIMGDYAKAEPLFRQALNIHHKWVLGENHPDYAEGLNSLAALYERMGDYAKAKPLLRQALEIRKRVLGENHPNYARSLNNLAWFYCSQGQVPAAEKCLSQALSLLTRWTQGGLTALGERQRLHLVAAQRWALNSYLSVAPAAGIKSEELYRHVLNWKGVVEASQDEDRLARDRPELKEALEQLKQARARMAHQAFTVPPAGQRQAWLRQLGALRERVENLDSDLARKSGTFRRVHESRRLGAAEVAGELPPGGVLVDLLDYGHFSLPVGGKGPLGHERRLLAFVLRRGRAPILVPLGTSRPIDRAVWDWRTALVAGRPQQMVAAARELGHRVWDPLKPHLEGATTVVVAPDGPLTHFPLAALPGRRPGTYLLEDVAIAYVSSAHRLSETLAAPSDARSENPEAKAAGLLAIGGIDYRADPGAAAPSETAPAPAPGVLLAESQRAGFKALAGTEPEARRIGQLFGATFPQKRALVLTGAEPTEAAVKHELVQHRRYVHLATHGFFESPARVAALRAGLKSDGFSLAGFGSSEESAALALSPLLHSGLALVGAARKTEDAGPRAQGSLPDREDGILTAEEVQSLDLRGTELVVLSACETGLGHAYYGQGVLGLQRAFHASGARTVIASLWKVDDAATSVLMEQFYTNLWLKKMSKLEALRQAQLAVLNDPGLVRSRRAELVKRGIGEEPEKLPAGGSVPAPSAAGARSDPSLWAAFVLSGDGR